MRGSASVELVMQLAGREAVSAQSGQVEAEHVLEGILKLAEMKVADAGGIGIESSAARHLAEVVHALRHELAVRRIDSKQARHRLRHAVGRGNAQGPVAAGPLHRSPAGRELFDTAARLASDAREEMITAVHLLKAALQSPTTAMVQALGDALKPLPPVHPAAVPLTSAGTDLVKVAAEGKLSPVQGRDVERRALIQTLAGARRAGVLIVSDDEPSVRQVVIGVACAIARNEAPASLGIKRIMDAGEVLSNAGAGIQERLEGLLTDIVSADDALLWLPSLAPEFPWESKWWMERLKDAVERGHVKFLCRVGQQDYRTRIQPDHGWKRLVQTMWIAGSGSSDIPGEL